MKVRLRTAVIISACIAVLLAIWKEHARMGAIITTFIVAPIWKDPGHGEWKAELYRASVKEGNV